MTKIDPEQEKRRLKEFYTRMTEGELQKIAADEASLTEDARQILKDEISRRELPIEIENQPAGVDEIDLRKLVMVRRFRDLPEALFAKGALESAGIPCFMADDNIVHLDWFISNLVGGIKLLVDPENIAEAMEVLDQPIPESFAVDGVEEYQQPRCPKCQSLDVTFQNLNKPIAYGSAFLNVPIPLKNRAWKCSSCGCEWEETDSPENNKS